MGSSGNQSRKSWLVFPRTGGNSGSESGSSRHSIVVVIIVEVGAVVVVIRVESRS